MIRYSVTEDPESGRILRVRKIAEPPPGVDPVVYAARMVSEPKRSRLANLFCRQIEVRHGRAWWAVKSRILFWMLLMGSGLYCAGYTLYTFSRNFF